MKLLQQSRCQLQPAVASFVALFLVSVRHFHLHLPTIFPLPSLLQSSRSVVSITSGKHYHALMQVTLLPMLLLLHVTFASVLREP